MRIRIGSPALSILALNGFTALIQHKSGHDAEWWSGDIYLRSALAGATAGAAVGGLVGGLRPAEAWRTVPLHGMR